MIKVTRQTFSAQSECGLTLIELILFIVIVSVGLAGVLASLNVSVKGSADPLQPKQALVIAEGLLEEVLLKNYADPGGASESSRQDYDNVTDFDPPDDGNPTAYTADLAGNLYAPYTPAVEIVNATVATLGVLQVTVTVGYPGGGSISLTGYRANY